MTDENRNYSEEELEELEDRLLQEAREQEEEEMIVSGKSVFELDRLKRKKRTEEETS